MAALYPRFALTPAIVMFLIVVIRAERYRYSFGRKWTSRRMATTKLYLPTRADGTPDWDFMSRYTNSLPFSSRL